MGDYAVLTLELGKSPRDLLKQQPLSGGRPVARAPRAPHKSAAQKYVSGKV